MLSKTTSTNIFQNFAFEYFEYLQSIVNNTEYKNIDSFYSNKLESSGNNKLTALFRSKVLPIPSDTYELFTNYWSIMFSDGLLNHDIDLSTWCNLVKKYVEFIPIAKKAFFIDNGINNSIEITDSRIITFSFYSDILPKPNNIVSVRFMNTNIVNINKNKGILESYIDNDDNDNITFVKIAVGDNNSRLEYQYKFALGDIPTFKDIIDEVAFQNISWIISKHIYKQYTGIMDKNILYFADIPGVIRVEELLKNGKLYYQLPRYT